MTTHALAWRTPEPHETARVHAMMSAAYHAADPAFPDDPAIFARYTAHDPAATSDDWVVGWIDGEPVTALRVFARDLRVIPGGATARLGGIGNVATHPAYGGRGLGAALLARTLDLLRRRSFALSLLYAGSRQRAFYERAGWRSLSSDWTRLDLGRPLAAAAAAGGRVADTLRIVDVAGATDGERATALNAAARFYDASSAATPGAIIRSSEYWSRWIGAFALAETRSRLLVAFRGFAPVAYLAGRNTESGLELAEGFAAPADEPALVALAAELGGGATMLCWPRVPWLDAAFGGLDGRAESITRSAGMGRAVAPGDGGFPAFRYLLSVLDRF